MRVEKLTRKVDKVVVQEKVTITLTMTEYEAKDLLEFVNKNDSPGSYSEHTIDWLVFNKLNEVL